jgi:hypothetical protein
MDQYEINEFDEKKVTRIGGAPVLEGLFRLIRLFRHSRATQ